jgi:hypothetical protein
MIGSAVYAGVSGRETVSTLAGEVPFEEQRRDNTMAIKNLITPGIGFNPGNTRFVITRGIGLPPIAYTQTATGSLPLTEGAITNQAQATKAGSLPLAGSTLSKAVAKLFTIPLSLLSQLIHKLHGVTYQTLTAALSLTGGTLSKGVAKALAANLAYSGTVLAKSLRRALTGSLSLAGTVLNAIFSTLLKICAAVERIVLRGRDDT